MAHHTSGLFAHGDGAVELPYRQLPEKGKWQHYVVTFDGLLENVYVDGVLNPGNPLLFLLRRATS
jgi:hypothetical protein